MAGQPGRTPPQPARKAKAGPGRKPTKPTVLSRVFARPGVIVAGATFAAVMTGIVANALILQKGHHPSPLFSPAETAQPVPVPPPAPRQVVEQPARAPEVVDAAPTQAVAEPPPAAAPAARVAPSAAPHAAKKPAPHPAAAHPTTAHKETAAPVHKAAPAAHKDPIAQLIGKAQ